MSVESFKKKFITKTPEGWKIKIWGEISISENLIWGLIEETETNNIIKDFISSGLFEMRENLERSIDGAIRELEKEDILTCGQCEYFQDTDDFLGVCYFNEECLKDVGEDTDDFLGVCYFNEECLKDVGEGEKACKQFKKKSIKNKLEESSKFLLGEK